jgi:hypothetical protein
VGGGGCTLLLGGGGGVEVGEGWSGWEKSTSSICSGMTVGQLRHFFHDSALCIRSYDPSSGSVSLRLPAYLTPPAAAGGG